jgi:transposase
MAEDRKIHVLSYEVWQQLEPLIEAARPPHRTDHVDLRQTIEAIIWRHQNGTKWRAIPLDLGPWWRAAQTFIRWSRLGVWDRMLTLAQERGLQTGMSFLDGTTIRAHHKAAGAEKGGSQPRRGTGARRWGALAAAMARKPA